MIKETCSCGASFETDGPKAEVRVAEWRKGHLFHASIPTYIPSYPVYPAPTWPLYPIITYTTTTTEAMCMSEVA